MIIRTPKRKNYTVVRNEVIRDERLSWKAKGLLVYLLSLPDDWELHPKEIQWHGKDGRDSVYSGIRELIDCGYMIREQFRREDGKFREFAYVVHEVPLVLSSVRDTGFPYADESPDSRGS